MSRLCVQGAAPLCGRIQVPGDKSVSHRALLLGSLAEGTSRVEHFLPAADCRATLSAVRALGVEVEELGPSTLILRAGDCEACRSRTMS